MKPIFALLLLFFMACNQHEAEKPKPLLEEDKMLDIMYDLALIQAVKSTGEYVLDDNALDTKTFLNEKYQIDEITWIENNKYYASNIRKYNQMIKKVQDRLEDEKKVMEEKELKKKKDDKKIKQKE